MMKIRDISADEALECLAEGGKCFILKELCEVTPAGEMMCARFVVADSEGGVESGKKQSGEADTGPEKADD